MSNADRIPAKGHWIWTKTGVEDYEQFFVCSECKSQSFYQANFCPNCGADMREAEVDE